MTIHGFLGQNHFQFVLMHELHRKYNFNIFSTLKSFTHIESL